MIGWLARTTVCVKMDHITKNKRVAYFVIGCYFLMGGIEYAVILPTVWLYISSRFAADEYMLGLLLSSYSLSCMIAGPILGRISDVTRKPKALIVICSLLEVVGNLMYWLGVSQWFLLLSRLVVGFGGGCDAVIFGEIARVTKEDERTGILSILISIRQFGLLIGPAFTIFLRLANFTVGTILVDKYNVPGAFMACLWMFQVLITVVLYNDLHKIKRAQDQEEAQRNRDEQKKTKALDKKPLLHSITSYNSYDSVKKDDLMATVNETDYRYMQLGQNQKPVKPLKAEEIREEPPFEDIVLDRSLEAESITSDVHIVPSVTCSFLQREYLREEIVAVLAIQFNCFFNQIGMETMLTPLSTKYLGFGELENSLMYCLAGLEIVIVFVLVRYLSKRLQDRTLLLIGLVILILAQCWCVYAVPSLRIEERSYNLMKLILGIVLDTFALPFLSVCSISLYSKLTSIEVQGLSQGLTRTVTGLATVLGPLWTGSTLIYPYIMLGVMLGLLGLSFGMLVLSFPKLKTNGSKHKEDAFKKRHALEVKK